MKYPHCRILPVEPHAENHKLLLQNLIGLINAGRCKTPLRAAVWGVQGTLIRDGSEPPDAYSAFRFREPPSEEQGSGAVQGIRIDQIIEESGFGEIDLLKADIEGAEVELFKGSLDWLRRVRAIAIEFHGNSREDCNFDGIMKEYSFKVRDHSAHTVLAVRDGGS
jgi:FkbM family methyltransferase